MTAGAARAALAAGLAALALGPADTQADPALLDAAWTLAELGQQAGDAALLASAAEAALAVAGETEAGRDLAQDWLDEARFLARGAAAVHGRIFAIEVRPPGAEAPRVAVARVPGGATVEISLGAAETGLILRPAGAPPPEQAGRALACALARTGGLWCAAAPEAGPVIVRGGGADAPPRFAFYGPAPRSPEEDGP